MTWHEGGYRFDLEPGVTRTPVRCRNRCGIEIAADLYRSEEFDERAEHAGVVIGPPHSAVEEQAPGVYANRLAKRGSVASASDPSLDGKPGGEKRYETLTARSERR